MNSKSWGEWATYFEGQGFSCHTPDYPFHSGDPTALRANPPKGLESLRFETVLETLAQQIAALPEKPILIGHSMGGLFVQKLVALGLAEAGICIDSAPPSGIIVLDWTFLKVNLPVINPLKGKTVCNPSVQWFHQAFCNTMTLADTEVAFQHFVVPESRMIPRQISGRVGKIDFKKPHAPLLFIAGEKDTIIPAALNRKNANAYKSSASVVDFKLFKGRSHFICGQKSWEEVAETVLSWIQDIKS